MEQALLGSFKVQETFVKVQNDIKNTMIIADNHLEEILRAMPVYYMPGEQEPSTTLLPQQPIHKCYFPKSSGYADFRAVTNPFLFAEKGITFLGTSGKRYPLASALHLVSGLYFVSALHLVSALYLVSGLSFVSLLCGRPGARLQKNCSSHFP